MSRCSFNKVTLWGKPIRVEVLLIVQTQIHICGEPCSFRGAGYIQDMKPCVWVKECSYDSLPVGFTHSVFLLPLLTFSPEDVATR